MPLKKDDCNLIISGVNSDIKTWITVEGFETVTVPAGTFNNCAKIHTYTLYPDSNKAEEGYAWLAENIGMIKWQRTTGRVDALSVYSFENEDSSSDNINSLTEFNPSQATGFLTQVVRRVYMGDFNHGKWWVRHFVEIKYIETKKEDG